MNLDSTIPSRASHVGKTPHCLLTSLKTARTTQIHKDGKPTGSLDGLEGGREEAEVTAGEQVPLGVSSSVGLLRGSDSGRNLFTWGSQVCAMCVQECAL